jgi:hypothetical protein
MDKLPTSTKTLIADLELKPASFARDEMIRRARRNKYHDFLGDEAFNIHMIVEHARRLGYDDIAQQAIDGKYDATKEEADAWAASPEGQETFAELTKGRR